ncbi:hypothetical protein FIU87_19195 [Bacillus sp. THAF10]|uniref:hypothetical protein n=1 Tax=Bacillus sp. THAF10 TaxID=2587848 RepID=UPI001268713E|nr:hypothetical protein [Bacillus sp. THAF10]QFT90775.1 hypothetical protein FIU87_19195 [Bacillus sp. THAF10]
MTLLKIIVTLFGVIATLFGVIATLSGVIATLSGVIVTLSEVIATLFLKWVGASDQTTKPKEAGEPSPLLLVRDK